jgi:hypothetical protein
VSPFCQFETTAEALLPGAVNRTSKNVSEASTLEPEMIAE